jgi:hypothetical protein
MVSAERVLPQDLIRNLLLGLLSVQADLVDRPQFLAAWEAWRARACGTLTDVLAEHGLLTFEERREVERLVQRKLAKHGGDAAAAVAEVQANPASQMLVALKDANVPRALASRGSGRVLGGWRMLAARLRHWRTLPTGVWKVLAGAVVVLVLGLGVGVFLFPPVEVPDGAAAGLDSAASRRSLASAQDLSIKGSKAVFTRLIQSLFTGFVRKDAVLEYLKHDPMLVEPYRQQAIQLAKDYAQDSVALNDGAWYVVVRPLPPGEEDYAYHMAYVLAREACRLEPNNGSYVNTLGVAEYRLGRHKQALQTLTRSAALNALRPPWLEPHAADRAFLAMCQYKLGDKSAAVATLQLLKQSMDKHTPDRYAEAVEYTKEAERLIDPWASPVRR